MRLLREKSERDLRAAEYGEEWSPREEDLRRNFRSLWTAQHQLIHAVHQLVQWQQRLATDRGESPPTVDKVLADLRNTLEHLTQASFEDGICATPGEGAGTSKNRSLRALPGERLFIDTSGPLLFQIIDPVDVEERALGVGNAIAQALDDEAESWVADFGLPSDD